MSESPEITSDDELDNEITMLEGALTDMQLAVDDKDWNKAKESADEAQDMMNGIHQYIASKAE